MNSKNRKIRLGDICDITSSKRIFAKEYRSVGIPFYRGKEIIEKQAGKKVSTELFIEESRYNEISKRFGVPQTGDILLTSVGTLGIPYVVGEEKFYFKDGNLTWIRNFNGADSKYIYYWLLSPFGRMQTDQKSIGSTQKALTIETLLKFEIDLPELSVQHIIANILSAFDDKITNNTKINHCLEQIAQISFERLLIEKATNEPLGILSDIAEINPPRALKKGEEARYIEMANLPTNGSFPSDWTHRPFSGGMRFKNGDTIMARITPCLENGKTAFINFLDDNETAYGSTEYIVISPKQGYCHEMFYFLARYGDFVSYAVKNMNGSSGRQRVSGASIGGYEMHIPSKAAVEEFAEIVNPIMNIIASNALENRNLAALRDSLLPRLMSGELLTKTE